MKYCIADIEKRHVRCKVTELNSLTHVIFSIKIYDQQKGFF